MVLFSRCERIKWTTQENKTISLQDLANEIRHFPTPFNAEAILDPAYSSGDADAIDRAKKTVNDWKINNLPYFQSCGTCPTRNQLDDLIFNGCIQIDIDIKRRGGNSLSRSIKKALCKLPYVALCFLSPSGFGVKAIVPTNVTDKSKYDALLELVYSKLSNESEIKTFQLSEACWDNLPIGQACYIYSDSEVYINESACLVLTDEEISSLSSAVIYQDAPQYTSVDHPKATEYPQEAMEWIKDFVDKRYQWTAGGGRRLWACSFISRCKIRGVPKEDCRSFFDSHFTLTKSEKESNDERIDDIYDKDTRYVFGCAPYVHFSGKTNSSVNKRLTIDIKERTRLREAIYHRFFDSMQRYEKLPRFSCIVKATGGGKTFDAAARSLYNLLNGIKTVFAAQDKSAIEQFYNYLYDILFDVEAEYKTIAWVMGYIRKIYSGCGIEISENDLIVITHHTYISRKRFKNSLYFVADWIDNHTELIIDEFPIYIDRQTLTFTNSALYHKIKTKNTDVNIFSRVNLCPAHQTGEPKSCLSCQRVNKPAIQENYNLVSLEHPTQMKMHVRASSLQEVRDFELNIDVDAIFKTKKTFESMDRGFRLGILHQPPMPGHISWSSDEKENTKAKEDATETLQDILRYCWLPHYQEEFAVGPDDPLSIESAAKAYYFDDIGKFAEQVVQINGFDAQRVIYPYNPCGIRKYFLLDTKPMRHFSKVAKRVVGLTATFNDEHLPMLQNVDDSFCIVNTKSQSDTLDKITVVVVGDENAKYDLFKNINEIIGSPFFKSHLNLIVVNYKSNARQVYDKIERSHAIGWAFADSDGSNVYHRDVPTRPLENLHNGFITYCGSVHAVGANLKDYDVAIVECQYTRPYNLYLTGCTNIKEVEHNMEVTRAKIVAQSANRITRGYAEKTMFLICPSETTVQEVIKNIDPRCDEYEIKRISVEQFREHYIKDETEEQARIMDRRKKAKERMRANRAGNAADKEKRKIEKIEARRKQIDDMISQGKKRSDIYNELHLERYPELRDYLFDRFEKIAPGEWDKEINEGFDEFLNNFGKEDNDEAESKEIDSDRSI